jgi:hypothetical protein
MDWWYIRIILLMMRDRLVSVWGVVYNLMLLKVMAPGQDYLLKRAAHTASMVEDILILLLGRGIGMEFR